MVGAKGFEPSTSWSRSRSRNSILLACLALFCVEHADFGPNSAPNGLNPDSFFDPLGRPPVLTPILGDLQRHFGGHLDALPEGFGPISDSCFGLTPRGAGTPCPDTRIPGIFTNVFQGHLDSLPEGFGPTWTHMLTPWADPIPMPIQEGSPAIFRRHLGAVSHHVQHPALSVG